MNTLDINLLALRENITRIDEWVTQNSSASWTLVTKALCGNENVLQALHALGVRSMADSRLSNLEAMARVCGKPSQDELETWYLRLPHLPVVDDIVRLAGVSLNSEVSTIEALNEAARRADVVHRVVIMIELGDLREGVLPGALVAFYERVFELSNIEVIGIGSNLGCLSGAVPTIDQYSTLCLYHELLELKFKRKLPMISAGTSAALPLLRDGVMPSKINHFRIGESVFLGTDLVNGDTLDGLRDDVVTLDVHIVEMREKSLAPVGETTDMMPFEPLRTAETSPGQRGHRAVITVGQLDTDVSGLTPVDPRYEIVGASSDLTVVHVGDNPEGLRVGDSMQFRASYGALVRLMLGKYIEKTLTPSLHTFLTEKDAARDVHLPPTLEPALDPETEEETAR